MPLLSNLLTKFRLGPSSLHEPWPSLNQIRFLRIERLAPVAPSLERLSYFANSYVSIDPYESDGD